MSEYKNMLFAEPLKTRYLVDAQGKFLGVFQVADEDLPIGAIDVPYGPNHALDIWNGNSYASHTATT